MLTTEGLKFLALSAAKLGDGKDLPNRLLIVPWGKTETIQGPVICNATTLRELPANQARRKRDRVALDFQHNTVEGSQFYKGEPAKVAAFASLEVIDGEGIYLSNIEWTPDGKAFAADGHYPDLSPAIITNDKGEVVLVHSAGLVRQGEIDGITLFSAPAIDALVRTLAPTEDEKDMVYKKILCAVLNLNEDATDEQLQAAAEALTKKKGPEASDEVKALAARIEAMEKRDQARTEAAATTQRDEIVRRASAEGKVIPLSAEEIKETPVKVLAAMVEKLPVTVPLEKRTPNNVREFSAGAGAEDASAAEIRKNLGLSQEAWDKHNKAA